MQKISTMILIITALFTMSGVFFKSMSNFMKEIVKMKYNHLPGERTVLQILLKILSFFIVIATVIYIIILFIDTIIKIIDGGIKITESVSVGNIFDVVYWVIFIAHILITIGGSFLFYNAIEIYIERLEGCIKRTFSKSKQRFNIFIIGISVFFIIGVMLIIHDYINKNISIELVNGFFVFESMFVKSDLKSLLAMIIMGLFYFIIFMLALNVYEIGSTIEGKYSFIIHMSSGKKIECPCYLEFNDYYLITDRIGQKCINKSAIVFIEPILNKKNDSTLIINKRTIVRNKRKV